MILNIFIAGWIILIAAIVMNVIAMQLGVTTWYPFLNDVSKMGFVKAFGGTSLISKLFLFVIYPLGLGLSAFLILRR